MLTCYAPTTQPHPNTQRPEDVPNIFGNEEGKEGEQAVLVAMSKGVFSRMRDIRDMTLV